MEIFCKVGYKTALATIAIKTDVEILRKLEPPLGERVGVDLVQRLIGFCMRVFVVRDLAMKLLMIEKGDR